MTLPSIGPHQARRLMDEGAVLLDIREADEYARERIPGGRHLALSRLDDAELATDHGRAVIFHCRSGARTRSNADALATKVGDSCDAYMLEGGLDGWRKAGLAGHRPPAADRAGSGRCRSAPAAWRCSERFSASPCRPGSSPFRCSSAAGCLLAGVTGFCGMAVLLQRAPWNRAADVPARKAA